MSSCELAPSLEQDDFDISSLFSEDQPPPRGYTPPIYETIAPSPSPLLRLPYEIRLHIYRLLLHGPDKTLSGCAQCDLIHPVLLRLNHQIHSECLPILYNENTLLLPPICTTESHQRLRHTQQSLLPANRPPRYPIRYYQSADATLAVSHGSITTPFNQTPTKFWHFSGFPIHERYMPLIRHLSINLCALGEGRLDGVALRLLRAAGPYITTLEIYDKAHTALYPLNPPTNSPYKGFSMRCGIEDRPKPRHQPKMVKEPRVFVAVRRFCHRLTGVTMWVWWKEFGVVGVRVGVGELWRGCVTERLRGVRVQLEEEMRVEEERRKGERERNGGGKARVANGYAGPPSGPMIASIGTVLASAG